jgi:hypothetical protein
MRWHSAGVSCCCVRQQQQAVTERDARLVQVALRDAAEALQLMSLEDSSSTAAAAANLPGRQSGAETWRNARGETGKGSAPEAGVLGCLVEVIFRK